MRYAYAATAYGGLKDYLSLVAEAVAVPTWASDSGTRFDLYRMMTATADMLGRPEWCDEVGEHVARLVTREFDVAVFSARLREIVDESVVRCRNRLELQRATPAPASPHFR